MLRVFHREMKVVNKEHQSILDLKLPFRNYDARIAFVCFEVPCCFEVHVPVLPNQASKKSFYTFEDIDLPESHAKLHKKTE